MKVNKIFHNKYYSIINDRYLMFNNINNDLINSLIDNYSIDKEYKGEKIDSIYKSITDDMDSVFTYYYNLQDRIEEMLYPVDSFYYLIINISKIYHLIDLGRYFIDRWLNNDIKKIRLIPNIEKKDINNKKSIFSLIDILYKKNIINFNDIDNIDLYDYEIDCLCALISIVPKIDGKNKVEVIKLIDYVDNTYNYLLKKYKEEQEKDETNFE